MEGVPGAGAERKGLKFGGLEAEGRLEEGVVERLLDWEGEGLEGVE